MAVNEVSSFQNSAYGTNAAANRRPTSSHPKFVLGGGGLFYRRWKK